MISGYIQIPRLDCTLLDTLYTFYLGVYGLSNCVHYLHGYVFSCLDCLVYVSTKIVWLSKAAPTLIQFLPFDFIRFVQQFCLISVDGDSTNVERFLSVEGCRSTKICGRPFVSPDQRSWTILVTSFRGIDAYHDSTTYRNIALLSRKTSYVSNYAFSFYCINWSIGDTCITLKNSNNTLLAMKSELRGLTKKFPDAFFLTPSGNAAATKLHVVLLWTIYYSQ